MITVSFDARIMSVFVLTICTIWVPLNNTRSFRAIIFLGIIKFSTRFYCKFVFGVESLLNAFSEQDLFVYVREIFHTSSLSVYVRNIKTCMGISKSLNIVKLHGVLTMLKLKVNVNLPQLLCIVVFFFWLRLKIANFEQFGGFYVNCYCTL